MSYTRTRRSSTFSSASDSSGRVSSPSIDPEAWLPQRAAHTPTPTPPVPAFDKPPTLSATPLLTRNVEPPDLFVTLLHDRGSAYRHSSTRPTPYLTASGLDERRSLARSLTSPVAEHSPPQHSSHVRTTEQARYPVESSGTRRESTERIMVVKALKVSRRRAGCSTKNATKSNGKCDITSQRKRSAAALEVSDSHKRASKVARVDAKANIGLKVDAGKVSIPEIIELSSESETDEEPPRKSGAIKKERSKTMLHYLKLQQPRKLPANSPVMGRASLWGHPKADSPKGITELKPDTDLKPDLMHALRETDATDEEMQRLRRDLQAANEKIHRLVKEIEKKEANANLERQKLEIKHTRVVEDEKAISGRLTEQVQDISVKNTRLESELRALQTQRDQEIQEHKEEQRKHTEVLDDILKPKAEKNATEEIEQIKKDNTRLSAENISLKAKVASSQNRAVLSPVPSNNSSTDDERKEDNIRKIYIKTKRQYDVLLAATKNLLACTRSMDLSCFGEFGSYIAKLRKSLEGEALSQSRQVQVVFKEDEEFGFGSQGSTV